MGISESITPKQWLSACLGWTMIVVGLAIVLRVVVHLDKLFAGCLDAAFPPSASILVAVAVALLTAGLSQLRPSRGAV